MKRLVLACAIALSLAATARPADLALGIEGGYFDMTNARQSAKAVFGSVTGGYTFGASVRFRAGESLFVGIGGRFFQREGQRAFVADKDSPAFRLGHPLTLRIIPVYAFLGYRFSETRKLVPYVGIGPGFTSYRETSVVGELEVEPLSQTRFSGHLLAGFEFGRGRMRFGVEVGYSIVPNSAGVAGVSRVYDESDIGGVTIVGRLVFAR
jgi:opacity protein-like surface antigen